MKGPLSTPRPIFLGVIFAAFLLLRPTTASTVANANKNKGDNGNRGLASGSELLMEMQGLHHALAGIQALIESSDLTADSDIVSHAAKLIRRVRSLVHAVDAGSPTPQRQPRRASVRRREEQRREERTRAKGGIGSGVVEEEREGETPMGEGGEYEDDAVARKLFDTTLTFPECKEMFLNACLRILSAQLIELKMTAEFTVHQKRDVHQDGYYKVVLVTDLLASHVKGRLSDGFVDYPFLWDDAVLGYPRILGVNGKWDCHGLTPDQCCTLIQDSCPNEDTNGNKLSCHIFVPFGGVGNKKRSNRIFINVSPDGRVQESPFVS